MKGFAIGFFNRIGLQALMFDKENVNRFDNHFDTVTLLEAEFVEGFKRHNGCHTAPGRNLNLDERHQFPLFYIRDLPGNTISCAYSHRPYLQNGAILLEAPWTRQGVSFVKLRLVAVWEAAYTEMKPQKPQNRAQHFLLPSF